MSTKRIKARLFHVNHGMLFNNPCGDSTPLITFPADAESYEQMVEQMAKAAAQSLNREAPAWFINTRRPQIEAALRAIGITNPTKKR